MKGTQKSEDEKNAKIAQIIKCRYSGKFDECKKIKKRKKFNECRNAKTEEIPRLQS